MLRTRLRGLYAITPDCNDGRRLLADVEAALAGGCRIVQYRDKTSNKPEQLARAKALHDLTMRAGSFVMRAPEIKALNLALEVHDAQLDGCTIKQLEDAIKAAKNAIRHNHEVSMT